MVTLRSRSPLTMGRMLLALALVAAAGAAWHHDNTLSVPQLLCYAAALVALPCALNLLDRGAMPATSEPSRREPWRRLDAALLGMLLLIAIVTRLYRLDSVPLVIFSDEIYYVNHAVEILRGSLFNPFASGPWDSLNLHAYTIAATYFVTPSMTSAARLAGVIPGVAAIWLEYVLLRRLFGRPLAFFAGLLMCLCAWNILIDRYGYHWSINQATALIAMYWLVVAAESGRLRHFAYAGYGLGFGVLYTYNAAFLPVGFVLYFGYLVLIHRRTVSRQVVIGWLCLILAAGIVAAPRLTMIAADPATLSYHRSVSVTNLPVGSMLRTVGTQYAEILSAFNYHSDNDVRAHTRGEGPLLDPITAAALGLGACYGLLGIRDRRWAFLVLTGLALLLPSSLSYGQTALVTSWRACAVAPQLCAFAAIPFALLWSIGAARIRSRTPLLAGLAVVFLGIGAVNYQEYFVDFPNVPYWQGTDMLAQTWAADRLLATPPGSRLLANTDLLSIPYIDDLTYGRRAWERLDWPDQDPLPLLLTPAPLHPTTIVGDSRLDDGTQAGGAMLMSALRYYYPCGTVDGRRNALGEDLYLAFTAQPDCIRAGNGLRAGPGVTGPIGGTDAFIWTRSPTGRFPFRIELRGTLIAPTEGQYQLTFAGAPAHLLLDGVPFSTGYLLPGLYNLDITATVDSPGQGELLWSLPGAALTSVPLSNLLARDLPSWGLQARYTFEDGTAFQQWLPGAMFTVSGVPFSHRPLRRIELSGALYLPDDGDYQFRLESASPAAMRLSGATVVQGPQGYGGWTTNEVFAARRGWHAIWLRIDKPTTRDLRFVWIGPNGRFGLLGGSMSRWR